MFVLDRSLDAEDRSPAFEGLVAATLPTDEFWSNLDAGIQIEAEGSFVLKNDFKDVVIG